MPTISQLPRADLVDPADLVPLSHDGETRGISVGDLLSGVQPAILAPSSTLLGRTSIGPGGPEEVDVGMGLVLSEGTLSANGADHASFPTHQTFGSQDFLVLSADGQPALLPVSALRALFSAGSNVAISPAGTISASGGGGTSTTVPIASLALASAVGAGDLLPISQAGVEKAIPLASLLNGQTIDMAQPAGAPADADTLWVAQDTSTMTRQTLGALWPWIAGKLPTYLAPTVEIGTATTLDATLHNGRVLVCSAPVSLSVAPQNMGNGFRCEVLNLSASDVTLDARIRTTSGRSVLPSGQAMTVHVVTYSGGTVVIGRMSGTSAPDAPGQVTGFSVVGQTATTVSLTWSAPSTGSVSSYAVSYRPTGSMSWTVAATAVTTTQQTVGSLSASTSYDFIVTPTNGGVSGPPSNIVTATTSAAQSAITAPVNLTVTSVTTSSVSLSWGAPATGTAQSYTIQSRTTGSAIWTGSVSGLGGTTYVASGLAAGQSYDWRVAAVAADGASAVSSVVVAATLANTGTVTSLSWNMVPAGPVTHGGGALGMNAHVTPASAQVQFGMSTSATVPPASWTSGTYVNTDLWGAYVPTPASAGTWYAWVEGVDGSCPTVHPTGIVVT